MPFLIRTNASGIPLVEFNYDVSRRWPHSLGDVDWTTVPKGTRVLVVDVHRAKHLPPVSTPRPDGLHEVELARISRVEMSTGYGLQKTTRQFTNPTFVVPGDPKRRPARVFGWFAWADAPDMVAGLVRHLALDRADQSLAALFTSYGFGLRRELDNARHKQAADDRRELLAAKAAAAGVSVDELEKGIDIWNKLRRKRFSASRCLCCGRTLTDPASIVSGVGPECLRHLPAIQAAARAKVLDIGKLRWDGDRLVERFKRAGVDELVRVVEAAQREEMVSAGRGRDVS